MCMYIVHTCMCHMHTSKSDATLERPSKASLCIYTSPDSDSLAGGSKSFCYALISRPDTIPPTIIASFRPNSPHTDTKKGGEKSCPDSSVTEGDTIVCQNFPPNQISRSLIQVCTDTSPTLAPHLVSKCIIHRLRCHVDFT